MRVMLDTNILVSAALFPSESTSKFMQLITEKHRIVLCEYVIDEFRGVVNDRFPHKLLNVTRFLHRFPFEFVYTQREWEPSSLPEIRDPNDAPILATAIFENVDVLVTGDKDFADVELDFPAIMTMTEFVSRFGE